MTVRWNATAIASREAFLDAALDRALLTPDPQIFAAAVTDDAAIHGAAADMSGPATYALGPVPGTRIKPAARGRYVLIYRRKGRDALVLDVVHARSNWRSATNVTT
ncbi:MAG: plasmid stabilization protein [Xanthomonadaceae bacterium]|nr:plasmid stabilization protein [Xanthomonadaceae bacterium]MDP2184430.1 plasmid stabilization protein [Xanthomonadales bacterium]